MSIKTIYLDMDGVLADFDKHFENLYGVNSREFEAKHGRDNFWRTVYKNPKFFETIVPNPKFMEIVNLSKEITDDVCILSSPSSTNQPLCMLGKRKWIDKNLGDMFPAFFEKKKEKYADHSCLLIDDYDLQVNNFRNAGGKAWLYDMNNHDEFVKFMKELKGS